MNEFGGPPFKTNGTPQKNVEPLVNFNNDQLIVENHPQDQTTPPIEYFLSRALNAVVITSTQVAQSNTVTLEAGHGVQVEEFIEIYNEDSETIPGMTLKRFAQLVVVEVNVNVIRFGQYIGFNTSPTTISFSNRVDINMNVVGTLDAPISFSQGPPNGFKWDLTRSIMGMVLDGSPDDSKFGDIVGGVANGIFFGFEGDLAVDYLVNIRSNAGLRGTAFDVNYVTRSSPQGGFGLSMRKSFNGMDKYGVAIRLDGLTSDRFVIYIQDDLSGFVQFALKVMGHIVED